MTIATSPQRKLTFEEYLTYDDGTDRRYELVDGELIALPPESEINDFIALHLRDRLIAFAGNRRIRNRCEVQVEPANSRYPDLVILRQEHIKLTRKRLTITLDMAPPELVVEVVPPGKANQQRDYVEKRQQYESRCIPEYWIVDPEAQFVIVLSLEAATYREIGRFQGAQRILSRVLPDLELTAAEILQAED